MSFNYGNYPNDFSSYSNQFGANTDLSNMALYRKEQEIQRLRMKISLLEQHQNFSSSTTSSLTHSPLASIDNKEMQLQQIEYQAAKLRLEYNNTNAIEKEKVKLESLLNQREYEIQEINQKHNDNVNKLERDLNKYKSLLNEKQDDYLNEKIKSTKIQNENDRLKSKIKELENYIGHLPTNDEVNEKDSKVNKLSDENKGLKEKIELLEKKVLKAKLYIKEKQEETKNLMEKIEQVEINKEKVKNEFENYKKATQEVGKLMCLNEENAQLKSDYEFTLKMVENLQTKIKTMQQKHEENIKEMKEKFKLEMDSADALRIELENKERLIESMQKSVKQISEQNQSLMSENLTINEKSKSIEQLINSDTLKALQSLFREMKSCTQDLDSLVQTCIDIYNGKPIDICSLLTGSKKNEDDCLDANNDTLSLINTEYLMKKTHQLKQVKVKLEHIRKMVSDQYAEKIGENISCVTQ